jgi:hypothetical protein
MDKNLEKLEVEEGGVESNRAHQCLSAQGKDRTHLCSCAKEVDRS